MKKNQLHSFIILLFLMGWGFPSIGQEILPFPRTPSGSKAGVTMAGSTHSPLEEKSRLPKDAPNILIILVDDSGFGLPNTFGGLVNTPNLTKVLENGIAFNRFHSTGMCSPTRAALLTGRNHTRVGNGQITEWANDWDGFSGIIPKTSATVAEILKNYGYSTAAFGKWHNSPTLETSKAGPFDYWPTGYGFEYFYGFLAGETSQYEPTLIKNTTYVEQPKSAEEGYHLTDDLRENAISWIRDQMAINPDKPFFMYWAPGAVHGPHHVNKSWADKYKGKFDQGWDAYRETVFENQKKLGWIPSNAQLTQRPENLASWSDIPTEERAFQTRLMEVFAGFTEHTDYNVGLILAELENLGIADNTLVFYIWGDNGSSAEGQNGTISELLAQNQIPTQISDHIDALNEIGGLDILGSPKTDNMYHAGWAWAGSTPFRSTKLVAAHFGGTRQPMVVSWPKLIKPDSKIRSQFHHVNDIVPTIYDILEITPPQVVNGFTQDPIDGKSMAYTFSNAEAEDQKQTQFFDVMGSRAIYHNGWIASTFGPRIPWKTVTPGLADWNPNEDIWELHNLKDDFSQANDLAQEEPEKLEELKNLFLTESAINKNLPIGGGLYVLLHPNEIKSNTATHFSYSGTTTRIPEFVAAKLGTVSNRTKIYLESMKNANGVLVAIAGYSGGLSIFLKDGYLHYEYNLFQIKRTKFSAKERIPAGKHEIEMILKTKTHESPLLNAGDIRILVDGKEVIAGEIPTLAVGFSANECLDIGLDLGSPVSETYYLQAPFKFEGTIDKVTVDYLR